MLTPLLQTFPCSRGQPARRPNRAGESFAAAAGRGSSSAPGAAHLSEKRDQANAWEQLEENLCFLQLLPG